MDKNSFSTEYIMSLTDPGATLTAVGGKGASLARLANAGLPVPGGFYISTAAYCDFLDQNELQSGIDSALVSVELSQTQTLEQASRKINALFRSAPIPDGIANAIVRSYASLPGSGPAVAVRSSATAEDLPEASFAGQQETYLNVSGPAEVLEAVRNCWASLWTARAIGYRARQQVGGEGVALAVVVQLLIPADAAGILFTANPVNGKRGQMMVSASWGLGEAVVGGLVTPDMLVLESHSGAVVKRDTAQKLVQTVRVPGGTDEITVPEQLQNIPVLNDKQASELCSLGRQIEALYGMPMDIEWALQDGAYAILQARPITALPEAAIEDDPIEWNPPSPNGTYMRTSVADLMPEPLSPLFVTLGIPTQREQMQPLGKRLLGSEPVLAEDYFTSINSYAYMNASFPPKSWWWALTGLLPAYPRLLRTLVPLYRDEFHPEYKAFVASKQGLQPGQMSAGELWRETQELVKAAAYYVCGLMFATMGASAGSEGLLTRVYDKMAKGDGDPEAAVLLMGWDNIPVRSEKSLYDIASWVREDKALTAYVLDIPPHDLTLQMNKPEAVPVPGFAELAARFKAHLQRFGHIVYQLDFAEPLPLDHPEIMLENIKMYLRGKGSNPHERQQASEQKRIQTTETMLGRLKGFKLWAFRKALNWGQSMAEVREDALAEIGLAYPKIRELLFALGQRFVNDGAIRRDEDIFWLERDEIESCVQKLEQDQGLVDLTEKVEARKAFDKQVCQTIPPPMMPLKERVLGFKSDMFIAQTEEAQSGNLLKGEATSIGKVTAPACVMRGPEDFSQMRPGDVLVAGTTTPAWTPIFVMASAVVTDIGGPLSHGSIVAREYGIPAVMGTGVATKRIQSGQTITVDGKAGTVMILDNGASA